MWCQGLQMCNIMKMALISFFSRCCPWRKRMPPRTSGIFMRNDEHLERRKRTTWCLQRQYYQILIWIITSKIITTVTIIIIIIIIPWLQKIIWVIGVLRRTVVGDWHFDNPYGSHLQGHLQSQSLSQLKIQKPWWAILLVNR